MKKRELESFTGNVSAVEDATTEKKKGRGPMGRHYEKKIIDLLCQS